MPRAIALQLATPVAVTERAISSDSAYLPDAESTTAPIGRFWRKEAGDVSIQTSGRPYRLDALELFDRLVGELRQDVDVFLHHVVPGSPVVIDCQFRYGNTVD